MASVSIPRSGWRKLLASWVLLFGSLALCAAAGEVILRLLGYHGAPFFYISNIYPVEDPVLDWRYVPNSQVKVGTVVYAYNSVGFRGEEHAIEKSPGITRVVVVGDSVTEGAGVEWKSVFASRLQSQVDASFEVINIAAAGLNTPQEVHLLEQQGLRYNPDLVILNFVLNDCDVDTNFKGVTGYLAELDTTIRLFNVSIDPRLKRLLKTSALIYFVKDRIGNIKDRLLRADDTDYFTNLWSKADNRSKVVTAFDELERLAANNRFDVVVIIWPVLTDYKHYRFQHVHEWVKDQVEKRRFSTIDLLGTFSRLPYRDLQVAAEDNIHPNALGHKLAVDAFLSSWPLSRTNRR